MPLSHRIHRLLTPIALTALLVMSQPLHSQTPATQPATQSAPRQVPQRFEKQVQTTLRLDYLLALPEGYEDDPEKKWPLVLFLHGAGERGEDLEKVKIHGPPMMIEQGHNFPAIVVSPQCPAGTWWTDHVPALLAMLDQIEADHRIDRSRIYVTGMSMGGYGTLALAARAPERFAAIAPVCGGGSPLMAWQLDETPCWLFHGTADPIVPVDESKRMAEWLKQRGNVAVRLTLYEGVGHGSWGPAYADPELWKWLFEQRR